MFDMMLIAPSLCRLDEWRPEYLMPAMHVRRYPGNELLIAEVQTVNEIHRLLDEVAL